MPILNNVNGPNVKHANPKQCKWTKEGKYRTQPSPGHPLALHTFHHHHRQHHHHHHHRHHHRQRDLCVFDIISQYKIQGINSFIVLSSCDTTCPYHLMSQSCKEKQILRRETNIY